MRISYLALIIFIGGIFPCTSLYGQCEDFMISITSDPPPPFNLCPGETILLTAIVSGGTGPYTYLWGDGATTPTTIVTPPYNGGFSLMVSDAAGCVAFESIHIKADFWTVDIFFVNTTYCLGDSMPLYAYPDFPPGTTFLWSTGDTTTSIFITTSGTYSLTATDPEGDCTGSITEFIEMFFFPQPDPDILGPTALCPGQNATLTAQGAPDDIYIWSTGEETSSITISAPGTFWVTVTNSFGCFGIDSLEVLPGTEPPIISAPSILCNGQNGTIEITNASSYSDFLWSTGETTSSIDISSPGTYSVTVTASGGCTATASVTVDSGTSAIDITGITMPLTSCSNPDGSVNITVTPPGSYSFIWSNGSNTEDINNLPSGSFTVTVTDAGGCSSSSTYIVDSNVVIPGTSATITATSCDLNNGAIDLSVVPSGMYTFLWSGGETTEDLLNILAGSYSITVTSSSNGCTASSSFTVPNSNPPITITGNTTPLTSCTAPNGTIDIMPAPAGTYTFLWSNGATTEDLTNLSAGSYTVTVSAGGSCTQTGTYIVANNTSPPVPAATPTPDTCSLSHGVIDLNVIPAGTYTFIWSNGSTTEDLTGIPGGTYSVTVTSSDGCTAITSTIVEDTLIPLAITGTALPNTSCTGQNGSIDITVNPPANYSYAWSNGATTEDLANLPAGSYTVTVSAGGSCTASATYSVDNTLSLPIPVAAPTPDTCGQSLGAIDLNVTPVGSYTYLWSNGSTSEDLSAIPTGNYSVTVTSQDGCTAITSTSIEDHSIPLAITGTSSPNTSCTAPNGFIDISLSPAGTYSYIWSNGATTEDLSNLPAGSYSITAILGFTCMAADTFFVDNDFTVIPLSGITTPNTSCSQPNGTIDLTVGIPGSFTFLWSNDQTTEDIQLLTGGFYTVTVTGGDGCTATSTFEIINSNSTFSFSGLVIPNTSCIIPNGSIDLTLTPPGAYTFAWSTGASSEDLQNLSFGNYEVTVTDSNDCAVVASFAVDDLFSFPQIAAQTTPSVCENNNGSIDITVIPVNGNTFSWSNGSTEEDQFNLTIGDYIVTVTSSFGCSSTDTFSIVNQNSNITISAVTLPNTSCSSPNGLIDITITPAGTYTFLWSNGESTEDLQFLSSGTYEVTVTDLLNCSMTSIFTIESTNTLPEINAVITPPNCEAMDGSIDINISPIGLYSILWGDGSTNEDLINIGAGVYTVMVTDTNNCKASDTFLVFSQNNSFSVMSTTMPNTSCVFPNGSVDLTIIPFGLYTFSWSNGILSEDLTMVSSGSYSVTVTDASLCSSILLIIVSDSLPIITSNAIISPSTCEGSNGSIDLSVSPSLGNSYLWSDSATTEDRANLDQGDYIITITTESGCTLVDTFTVPNLGSPPVLTANINDNTNCLSPNGAIDLFISPAGLYTFFWSNGMSSEDLPDLSQGNYMVTVTDINGCSSTGNFIINNMAIIPSISSVISPSVCGDSNGAIDITVNPNGSYQFAWSGGEITEDIYNLKAGTYLITVTGSNGCSANTSFTVPNTATNFSINAALTNNTSCDFFNGAINLTVSPSGIYTFQWSNGAGTEDLFNLEPGTYTVTVSDSFNCSTSDTFTIADDAQNLTVESTLYPAKCGEPNGSIDLMITPSNSNNYIWSDGSTSEDLLNIFPGNYSITITSQTGCIQILSYLLTGSENLNITLEAVASQAGNEFVNIQTKVNVPLNALDTIIWLPEILFDCIGQICLEQTIKRPNQQTEINVIAIDTNGCLAEARLILKDIINPAVFIPNIFTPNGDGINDIFTLYGNKDVELILELQIFDRWGNQVFIATEFPPNQENYGWDGTFRYDELNPAVFVYWARVRFRDGSEDYFKGDITLVK